ncbi:DacB [Desulforapulum autotrophicum HRM2]|uniref:Beta-lactamase n=1 Tax=Desulforapulum autotrophicum (strain ATCC 43914 / DSM 3382 / VKM B-1955 / HRM2) TaxID=177437 RepID=C0QKM6_DESAH|nr:D-alanyl-D-alanine carboxypeptidase [Desulforapulum autotrophicum]ACN16116.1 DacB [Desulforapulum autotrophicum HRM2]
MPFLHKWILLLFLAMALVQSPGAIAGTPKIGYLVADSHGKVMDALNPDQAFVPASTFKLLTALGAFNELGENFRFKTKFFLGPDRTLKIKGSGDPLITSEILEKSCCDLASILLKKGVSTIKTLVVDNLFFEPDIQIPGTGGSTNPYDAGVNALSANFNTVSFRFDKHDGQLLSGEPQTPLLSFTRPRILASGLDRGRIVLSRIESRTYAGRLVKFFLEQKGIKVMGGVEEGQVLQQDLHIYTHVSPYTLAELVRQLLQFSNNFMANQIFLTAGAAAFSPPASLEKSVGALRAYASNTLGIENISIAEGSGISRRNRISPREMLKVLMAFKSHYSLMNHERDEFYKTGTLDGVRTRVGYFTGKNNSLFPFIIMINQQGQGYKIIKERLKSMVQ